jgi:LuxR family quorum sensing-dependent transcriptional regulator
VERVYPGVLDFIDGLERLPTAEAAWAAFMEFSRSFGLAFGGLADMPGPTEKIEDTLLCLSWPEEWRKRYFENNYIVSDPAQIHLSNSVDPYTWDQMLDYPAYTKAQRRIVEEASEFGLVAGFIIPIIGLRTGPAMVTVAGTNRALSVRERAELQLAAIYAHSRIRSLSGSRRQHTTAPLSPRERECLQWVAAGKSDWEIGEILTISEKTANVHIERAKRKYGVTTRAQAIVQALRSGDIRF